MFDKKSIGKRIKTIRERQLALSTEAFGALFDPPASKGTVSKWENGIYTPNKERMLKISELSNIHINKLIYGTEKNYFQQILSKNNLDFDMECFSYLSALVDFSDTDFDNENNVKFSYIKGKNTIFELEEFELLDFYNSYKKENTDKNKDVELNLGAHLYLAASEVDNENINAASKYYKQRFNKSTEEAYNELNDK